MKPPVKPEGGFTAAQMFAAVAKSGEAADYTLIRDGSTALLRANNDEAYQYLFDMVQSDAAWSGPMLGVELPYLPPILDELIVAGFKFER